jgi:hypothetical protein
MPTKYTAQKLPLDADPEALARAQNMESRRVQDALNKAGGTSGNPRYVTSSTYIASTDSYIFADTTGGAITLTLPLTTECMGSTFCIKRVAGANALTVQRRGSSDNIYNTSAASATSITVTTPRWLVAARRNRWEEV